MIFIFLEMSGRSAVFSSPVFLIINTCVTPDEVPNVGAKRCVLFLKKKLNIK